MELPLETRCRGRACNNVGRIEETTFPSGPMSPLPIGVVADIVRSKGDRITALLTASDAVVLG